MSHAARRLVGRVVRKLRNLGPVRWLRSDRYLLLYVIDREAAQAPPEDDGFRRNRAEDLELFEQTERWLPREEFVAEAKKRLANGAQLYTVVAGQRLVHYGWLIPNQQRAWFPFVQQHFEFPPGSAMLFNAYTHPAARGQRLHERSMRRRIHDALEQPETLRVYTAIERDNRVSQASASRAGFRCSEVLYERIRFGATERGRLSAAEYFRTVEPAQ